MTLTQTSDVFAGFDRLYSIDELNMDTAFRADVDYGSYDYLSVTRGEVVPVNTTARWKMGRALPNDFIFTTLAIPILISDTVLKLLSEHEIRGWHTYGVKLNGRMGDPIEGFHGLSVSGRCGAIKDEMSQRTHRAGRTYVTLTGLYFEPDTWDRSDIFMPAERNGWIIVNEKLKKLLQKAKIRNLGFTPLSQVRRPKHL